MIFLFGFRGTESVIVTVDRFQIVELEVLLFFRDYIVNG